MRARQSVIECLHWSGVLSVPNNCHARVLRGQLLSYRKAVITGRVVDDYDIYNDVVLRENTPHCLRQESPVVVAGNNY